MPRFRAQSVSSCFVPFAFTTRIALDTRISQPWAGGFYGNRIPGPTSVAHYALVRPDQHHPAKGDSDASEATWHPLVQLPPLAFDHSEIIAAAHERLRGKVRYQPVGFELLPARFTLGQLQSLYEATLGRPVDKRNFRKKVLGFDFLVPLEAFTTGGAHRPARLHRFDRRKYQALVRRGFDFEL